MKSPHNVIQLSRLSAPIRGKGRPYTVDFGIAKPLYKQLLSKCSTHLDSVGSMPYRLGGFSLSGILKFAKRTRTYVWRQIHGNKLRLIPGFIAFYMAVGIPMNSPSRIVYADPLINPPKIEQAAMLTMPAVASVEPLQSILIPVAVNLSNLYTPGQCTAYVASKLPIPSDWGNAINWGYAAILAGYEVSDIPKVGAVAWSTTDSYLGHVALVESINGDQVTISEQNYAGPFIVDTRLANPGEFRYIYF